MPAVIEVVMPGMHEAQVEVRDHPARFKVLAAGRRWGKTLLGSSLCVARALSGGRVWWVAPTYKMGRVGWRGILTLARQIPFVEIMRGERMVRFAGGGEVWVRSADDPDSLRGEGLDFVVLDECAFMKEDVWEGAIRPALADRKGKAILISTPKGKNWFYRLWYHGQYGEDVGWASFQYPAFVNPFLDKGELERMKENMSERMYRQEILAEFLDDAGGVFRNVVQCATAKEQEKAVEGHTYVIGVDWARSYDFTVFAVLDMTENALIYVDRFSDINYQTQLERLKVLHEKFRPVLIIAEENSMGGPLVEMLQREGLPIYPFRTTSASKQMIVDSLSLAFEKREIQIIPDSIVVEELQAFEQKRMPSGVIRYAAPPGMHDDTVIALALAWWGSRSEKDVFITEI